MTGKIQHPTLGSFEVKTLSPVDEMRVASRRMALSEGQWSHLASSEYQRDIDAAVYFQARAELELAVVEAPTGFSIGEAAPAALRDLWQSYRGFVGGSGEKAREPSGSGQHNELA